MCHENEHFYYDGSDLLINLGVERICGNQIPLPQQTLSARSGRSYRGGETWLAFDSVAKIEMSLVMGDPIIALVAVIERAGLPALRIAFSIAVLVFLYAGILIFRRRHQYFDRDPNVENDVPVVRHNREELILFIWTGMTLVLISILYQMWHA